MFGFVKIISFFKPQDVSPRVLPGGTVERRRRRSGRRNRAESDEDVLIRGQVCCAHAQKGFHFLNKNHSLFLLKTYILKCPFALISGWPLRILPVSRPFPFGHLTDFRYSTTANRDIREKEEKKHKRHSSPSDNNSRYGGRKLFLDRRIVNLRDFF